MCFWCDKGLDWSWMSDTVSNCFGCNSSFYINKVVCSFSHILVHIYDANMFQCCWFHLFIVDILCTLIIVVFYFFWQVQIEQIQFKWDWWEQFKGDQGSERLQVSSFISSIYYRKRLNHFVSVVLRVTTHLGKMCLSVDTNSI